MRVCLLTYDDRDPAEPDAPHVTADPRPFLPEALWDRVELDKATSVQTLVRLTREPHDLYFNLCDGGWDSSIPGIEVVDALERLDVPFTGADSGFYDPSREAMKRVCAAWGVAMPDYVMAADEAGIERALDTLRFPLIVKHPNGYGSVDLTAESRVHTADGLRARARSILALRGRALIEEFVDGGEATVLVAENPDDLFEPVTYAPIEYRFPPGESFKHYQLKWHDYHGLSAAPVRDPGLEASLREAAAALFTGLGGAGYGRCDLRIDGDGRPVMLEINPNCGIFYPAADPGSADLCLLHDPAGHQGFTRTIVDAALRRHARRRRGWEVRPIDGGFGIVATRAFRPGDPVIRFEGEPHTLVSRSHVEKLWNGLQRDWFRRYAWPLTEEVWVLWDRDPEHWKPINHSCDPSAWIEGLDVVARRAIDPGDEVTLDYATFYNEVMPDFECQCGTAACRGVIRGSDYRADFVDRYGDHVSDYVRRRRESAIDNRQSIIDNR